MNPIDLIQDSLKGYHFMGTPVFTWLAFLVGWAAATGLVLIVHRVLRWRIKAVADRTVNEVDNYASALLDRTRWYFLLMLALWITSRFIDLPVRTQRIAAVVMSLVLLLQVGLWGNMIIHVWIERYRARKLDVDAAAVTSVNAVGWLVRIALWSVILLLVLDRLGQNITALVTGLGIGGVAVALAVQNILGDLFASLSILLDKPFSVGDSLTVDSFTGTVEHVGLKTTRMRSISGEQIIISNGDLLKSRIRNFKRMSERRVAFELAVAYQTSEEDLEQIPRMVREIVSAHELARLDRAHFTRLGASALHFEVVYFMLTPDYAAYMDVHQAINLAIIRQFRQSGIEFALPAPSVVIEQAVMSVPTTDQNGAAEGA